MLMATKVEPKVLAWKLGLWITKIRTQLVKPHFHLDPTNRSVWILSHERATYSGLSVISFEDMFNANDNDKRMDKKIKVRMTQV